ncbi:hypothetical protein SLS62_006892 [Diatrype stigma]|uniref:Carboxylic ester hydrolase n=1 Tax=Diatrype stigma TaxID=117547 RepID=A0AAN9YNS4_9PEZI
MAITAPTAKPVAAKKLAPLFYDGQEVGKSYYLGCSRGGGQGIKAAEMFPEDFDGILAGAPAVDFDNLYSWRASFFPLTGAVGSGDFISAGVWNSTIHDEVLRQCDGIDGVLDGIIEDPTLCQFQPDALLCDGVQNTSSSSSNTACLTAAQVQIVQDIFADYTWPNGSLLFPAMQPGSEILAAAGLYSGAPFPLSLDWFRFAVLEDPNWDASTYGIDDALLAAEKNPGDARTWPSSSSLLAGFARRGGRILTYHGLQDQQITSYNSIRFYEHLLASSNTSSSTTTQDMDQFYRFFRVPGMSHCSGGPGAWVLGQKGAAAEGIPFDAEHNLLAALVAWVEDGAAPETITGTKFVDDDAARGVAYRHRHCKYPSRSTYLGSGLDPLEELSWACV